MKLFQFIIDDNQIQIGILLDNKNYNFSKLSESSSLNSLQKMIREGKFTIDFIRKIVDNVKAKGLLEECEITDEIKYDVPISDPDKILCYGVNYAAHAVEGDNPIPDEPILFGKFSNTLLPHNGTIAFPKKIGRVDHEIELAVVIGKDGKNIPEDEAMDYVAGYTIINDISARKMQIDDLDKSHPWLRSKGYDTFCPVGPYLVPSEAISEPQNIDLTLKINGDIKQQSNTSRMIFQIPRLINFASEIMTLKIGDIICTGTPSGISEIVDGDIVTCELSGLGILSNTVKSY